MNDKVSDLDLFVLLRTYLHKVDAECKKSRPLLKEIFDVVDLIETAAILEVERSVKKKRFRERLPDERNGFTRHFTIRSADGPVDVYITPNTYEDGRLGEVFLRVGQTGGLARGALDAVAIVLSIGLQYGIPLKAFTSKLRGTRFPPEGMTGDPDKDLKYAASVLDLVARYLEKKFFGEEAQTENEQAEETDGA